MVLLVPSVLFGTATATAAAAAAAAAAPAAVAAVADGGWRTYPMFVCVMLDGRDRGAMPPTLPVVLCLPPSPCAAAGCAAPGSAELKTWGDVCHEGRSGHWFAVITRGPMVVAVAVASDAAGAVVLVTAVTSSSTSESTAEPDGEA